jgi:integrase
VRHDAAPDPRPSGGAVEHLEEAGVQTDRLRTASLRHGVRSLHAGQRSSAGTIYPGADLRLYQRSKGGIWWCWYYGPDGNRIRLSTKCRDKRAAELFVRNREREAHDPRRAAENEAKAKQHTVADALDYFLNDGRPADIAEATVSMYLQKAGQLIRLVGGIDVNALKVSDVIGYTDTRLGEGAARGTIHKELVTLRRALRKAAEREILTRDWRLLLPEFKVNYQPKTRWLTSGEFLRLLQQLPPHRQLWVFLAVFTSSRDSEVDSLAWRDVDWADMSIRIRGAKTDESDRVVPLAGLLFKVLHAFRQPAGLIVGEWLNVRRDLHAACARAKIDPCSPNDLRRTFASWLKQKGVDSFTTAKLMGHSSTRMVEKVYAQLDSQSKRSAIALLPGGCDTGVPNSGPSAASLALVTQREEAELTEFVEAVVLGPRVELGTRGFSVRMHFNPFKNMDTKKYRV